MAHVFNARSLLSWCATCYGITQHLEAADKTFLQDEEIRSRIILPQKQAAAVLHADWKPRPDYQPTEDEIRTKRANYASRVWHNPRVAIEEILVPEIGPKDVLVEEWWGGYVPALGKRQDAAKMEEISGYR